MTARITKGTHSAARHSLLDELTFNRDFDHSESTSKAPTWNFHPSYSGFSTPKTRTAQERGLPVNMMDTFLSNTATVPQIVPTEQWRTNRMIKSNPTLRGFVTDKITSVQYEPAQHERKPMRTSCSKLVHDHEQALLVNITTPSQYSFVPAIRTSAFRPLGSLQPAAPGRPYTTHEPGRHRYFVSDVRVKLP